MNFVYPFVNVFLGPQGSSIFSVRLTDKVLHPITTYHQTEQDRISDVTTQNRRIFIWYTSEAAESIAISINLHAFKLTTHGPYTVNLWF